MIYAILAVLCLGIMSIFIYEEHKEKYVLAVILKGLASLCFVVLGFIAAKNSIDKDFSKLVKVGLILGLVADLLLNLRFVFKKKGKIVFLVGILVFLSGHVLYLCALLPLCKSVILSCIIAVVVTVLLLKWIFSKIEAQKAFKIFGVFYIGAIVLMNSVAIMNLVNAFTYGNLVYVLGAISFLVSDVVLILNTFGKTTKFSLRITNLSLYYVGQLLIAVSLLMF